MTVFRVLALGDVCGSAGVNAVKSALSAYKRFAGVDFCVVNGENASGFGVTAAQCQTLLDYGADVVTLGNHAWGQKNIIPLLEESAYVLRPANFSARAPGRGYGVYETRYGNVCVVNLIGRVGMDPSDSPFTEIDRILKRPEVAECRFTLVDFHAEATSEKIAMAYHLDGRVNALWGTHTHVQTNDARVFRNGLGYVTDLGMTGACDSVIGMKVTASLSRFLGDPKVRHEEADGTSRIEGALFEVDAETGRCVTVELVKLDG